MTNLHTPSPLHVFKLHGTGNDFVLVDARGSGASGSPVSPGLACALCDRHRGVGADGVLTLLATTTPGAHARMHVTNADGSHAEMCGNGLRCVALHVARTAPEEVTSLVIETDAGLRDCAVTRTGPDKAEVSVDMGVVMVGPAPGVPGSVKLEVEGMPVRATAANVGNPHMVMDLPPNQQQARRVGESLTRTPVFPAGVNVEWMSLDANGGLIVLVYERGAGLTLACGTGAVAAAFVAAKWGWVDLVGPRGVSVRLPGGTLWVKQDAGGRARLTGPAQHVFSAQVDLASLGIRP